MAQASISTLPGPQSKPSTGVSTPRAGSPVRLLIPPTFTTARGSSPRNAAAWKAGASGAPWPAAATSRLRKSATTSMPVNSASAAGALTWIV